MVRMRFAVGVLLGVPMALLGCSGSRPLGGAGGTVHQRDGGTSGLPPGRGSPPDAGSGKTDAVLTVRDAPALPPDAGVPLDSAGERAAPAACSSGSIVAHSGEVALAAYSPDGRFIATMSGIELSVWNAADRTLLWTKVVDSGALPNAQIATFTPDSSRVLVTGSPPRLLAVADGQQVGVLAAGRADTVAISPDGALVAGGCQCSNSGGARLWRVETGAPEAVLGDSAEQAFGVAFSPDGSLLAVRAAYPVGAGMPGTSVWRLSDLTRVWDADREPETPTRLAYTGFSPDGALLVSIRPVTPTTEPFVVRVRRATDGTIVKDLKVTGRPRQAVFSPDGNTLVVAAADGLHLFDTTDWTLVRDLPGSFLSAGFSPDGRALIAGASDGALHFFCP